MIRQRKKNEDNPPILPSVPTREQFRAQKLNIWTLTNLVRAVVLFIVMICGVLCFIVYKNQGIGGDMFPDRTTKPILNSGSLEIVASLPSPPGNLALDERGRIFFTFHPEYGYETKLAQWFPRKRTYLPFPDEAFQSTFVSPLAVRVDEQRKVLYVLDHGNFGFSTDIMYAFDLSLVKPKLKFKFTFPSNVAPLG
jgi:hypothetical protein